MPHKFLRTSALFILSAAAFSAHAQTPFTPGQSVAIAKPGTNSAAKNYTIYTTVTPSSATFTAGTSFTPLYNINGIGINGVDNFVYGAAFTGNTNNIGTAFNISLFRIGANGVTVDLGILPTTGAAGSGALEFVNFSAGTVTIDGTYYYMTYAITPAATARITNRIANNQAPDLTAADLKMYICWKSGISLLTSNPGGALAITGHYEIDFSDAALTASLNAFLTQVNATYPNVFDADGGIQDIAFNPTNGRIYGYMSYPSGASVIGRAVTLSVPSGGVSVATPVGTVLNTVPGQEAAGVQFDIAGNLFTLFTTGGYSQVNLTTGALVGIAPSNLALLSGNLRGDIASTITATPLGMSLLSFNGRNNGAANELSWTTATEQNNKEFTVERSADQRDWIAIGTVATKAVNGNSDAKLSYNFSDNAPQAAVVYYRLKQTDRDSKTGYSSVVSIATGTGSNIVIFPNPADESMKISGVQTGNVIRISDITGKIVRSQKVEGSLATLDLSGLAPNMYIVEVSANGTPLYTGKVIKK